MSTHQKLLYHIVFSTKNRKLYLKNDEFRQQVFSYMTGTAKELSGFAIKIGGYYDHVHLLLEIPAKLSVSKFVGQLKASTSKHVNETSGQIQKFGWQDGFGVFTVSPSQQQRVIKYLENQVKHHGSQSFEEEYIVLLDQHEIEYDLKYVFE